MKQHPRQPAYNAARSHIADYVASVFRNFGLSHGEGLTLLTDLTNEYARSLLRHERAIEPSPERIADVTRLALAWSENPDLLLQKVREIGQREHVRTDHELSLVLGMMMGQLEQFAKSAR